MRHIKENIDDLNRRKEVIAERSGRAGEDILLVAVTKTRTAEEINEAIKAGITDIGENKVQEILDKYEKVNPVRWHMIGHLQTNKVKYIIDKVAMIHSVDSLRLAQEIDRRAELSGLVMDILIQINAAQEESKFGIGSHETDGLIRDILESCSNVRIRGLMTIAPLEDDPESVREYFSEVRDYYNKYRELNLPGTDFRYLSMGMSNDYEVAIEEGSNLIRVGTAIFGRRNYNL